MPGGSLKCAHLGGKASLAIGWKARHPAAIQLPLLGNQIMMFARRNWRWLLAVVFFLSGFFGFLSGVEVTERDIASANHFTLMYYSLGLFILGGMDLGVPIGGPVWGQGLLWLAYFGAPLLMTSAIAEWLQVVVANPNRWLRSLHGHTIIVGVNDLSRSIMDKIVHLGDTTQFVVVERDIRKTVRQELEDRYNARCLAGDYTDSYFINMLRVHSAKRIVLVSENNFDNFEAASKLLEERPDMGSRIIVHSNRLRYLRAMAHTDVVHKTHTFNSYHLAAKHLVRTVMIDHFHQTERLDTVVIAGFGIFGQTVLEELQSLAAEEVGDIAIIDADARRRVLVAEEQVEMRAGIRKHVFEGDIGHPEVWQKVRAQVDLSAGMPLVLLATGKDDENLRTGIWLSRHHPNAKILVRSQRLSHFAEAASVASGIVTFGLSQVFQESIPDHWFVDKEPEAAKTETSDG